MNDTVNKLNAIRHRILVRVSMANEYQDSWGADYVLQSLREAFSPEKSFGASEAETVTLEELEVNLSREELYSFGFGNWDGELILLPLWVVNFISGDPMLIDIFGEEVSLSKMDRDVRGGAIAAGFKKQ